ASAAASPVWVAVDRACRVRRRGVRWRSRAGWFAAPISGFSALLPCLRGCLLAIVFILWIRIALRDACTTTSPALGARRVATQEGAVDSGQQCLPCRRSRAESGAGQRFLCCAVSFSKRRRWLSASPLSEPAKEG